MEYGVHVFVVLPEPVENGTNRVCDADNMRYIIDPLLSGSI
jgi:hypothetical protein